MKNNSSGKMKSICLLLALLGLALAEPNAYFVEKFETGTVVGERERKRETIINCFGS